MALLHVDFFSDVLGMGMNMDVILPQKTSKQIGRGWQRTVLIRRSTCCTG